MTIEQARIEELLSEYGGYDPSIKLGHVFGTCTFGEFLEVLHIARCRFTTVCLSALASNQPCAPDESLKRCLICGFVITPQYAPEKPTVPWGGRSA